MPSIDRDDDLLPQLCEEYDTQHNIAPLFSSSATYTVGQYVIYDADLYKCIEDVSLPGAWNSSKWNKVVVVTQLGEGFSLDAASWSVVDNNAKLELSKSGVIVITSDGLQLPTVQSLLGNTAIGTSATGVYYNGSVFLPVTPEHQTSKNVIANTANGATNTVTTNSNTYLNHTENGTVVDSHKIVGTGGVTVSGAADGTLTINSEGGGGMEADPYKLEVKSDGIHLEKNDIDFALGADDSFTVSKLMTKKPGATGSHYSIFEDTDGSLVFTVE